MKPYLTLFAAFVVMTAAPAGAAGDAPVHARFARFSYTGQTQERAVARPDQYLNPVLAGYFPDPSVLRVGDDYFVVTSSFTNFPGLPIMHSKDLVTWTQIGNALDRPGQVDFTGVRGSQGIYAPDISFHNGRYYIITTCASCPGVVGNFITTATDPGGPWSIPVTVKGLNGIDPSLFWDGDKVYVVHNDEPKGRPRYDGHRAIWITELDPATMQRRGVPSVLVDGGADPSKNPIWIEGPHIFKNNGYYYLICAEGGTADNHSEVVFRSASATGPYVPGPANPILTQRDLDPRRPNPVTTAGHAKFVQTPQGDWWSVFLGTRPYPGNFYNIGRDTFLLPVIWKDDWPVILEPGKPVPYVVARPELPQQPAAEEPLNGNFSYVEEFDGPLAPSWIGIRTPRGKLYELDRGDLVLRSGRPLGDLAGAPGFIGRRQQHHTASVSTVVDYAPRRNGDRAGLVAMQGDAGYVFLGLTRLAGQRVVALYAFEGGKETLVASAPVADRHVELIMNMSGGSSAYSYRSDGVIKTLKTDLDVTFLSTQKAKGFVGVVIGPYVQTVEE